MNGEREKIFEVTAKALKGVLAVFNLSPTRPSLSPSVWAVGFVLLFSGCNNLKRLTEGATTTPPASALPNDYTVTGITHEDLEIIEPIRTIQSVITVRINKNGWRELNQYEYKVLTDGNGGILFRKEVILEDGKLILTGKPVAPKGTEYEIRSQKESL